MTLLLLFSMSLLFRWTVVYGFVDFNETIKDGHKRKKCLVAMYDTVRGHLNWHQEFFVKTAKALNIQIAEVGKNPDLQDADVLIFHAPSHKATITKKNLKKKYTKAIFVMTSMEQPLYAPVLQQLEYLKNNFDMMVTYSLQPFYPGTGLPNLPITYFPSHILPVERVQQKGKPFKDKTGYNTGVEVVLFTSNCKAAGASERYRYIEELMKLIEIHSYGKCHKNREEPEMPDDPAWPAIAQRRARKIKVLSNYKFYLAFENAPIDDYVSEKVFEGLLAGTISVYRGAKQIHKFMPSNHSFIDANQMSPKELASFLKKLGSDEKTYNSYLKFQDEPLPQSFREIGDMSYVHPNVMKRMCDKAFQLQEQKKLV